MEQINNYVFLIGMLILTVIFTVSITKMIINKEKRVAGNITEMFYDSLPYILSYADDIIKLYNSSKDKDTLIDAVSELIYMCMLNIIINNDNNNEIPEFLTKENVKKYAYPLLDKLYSQKVVNAYLVVNSK